MPGVERSARRADKELYGCGAVDSYGAVTKAGESSCLLRSFVARKLVRKRWVRSMRYTLLDIRAAKDSPICTSLSGLCGAFRVILFCQRAYLIDWTGAEVRVLCKSRGSLACLVLA